MLKRKFLRSFPFCASLHICFVRCCPQRLMIPSEILSLLFIVLLFLSMILESAWPSPKQRATKAKERFLTGYAWWILIRRRRLRETSINEKRSMFCCCWFLLLCCAFLVYFYLSSQSRLFPESRRSALNSEQNKERNTMQVVLSRFFFALLSVNLCRPPLPDSIDFLIQ